MRVFAGPAVPLLVGIGMAAGAVGISSRRKWGYIVALVCSLVPAIFILRFLAIDVPTGGGFLQFLLSIAFYLALVVALLHKQSREYQRVWFD